MARLIDYIRTSEETFNIIDEIHNRLLNDLFYKREQQVLQRLAELGFTFHDNFEKNKFYKERLTLYTFQDKPYYRELILDGSKLIACWDDTPCIENDGQKITVTLGRSCD